MWGWTDFIHIQDKTQHKGNRRGDRIIQYAIFAFNVNILSFYDNIVGLIV